MAAGIRHRGDGVAVVDHDLPPLGRKLDDSRARGCGVWIVGAAGVGSGVGGERSGWGAKRLVRIVTKCCWYALNLSYASPLLREVLQPPRRLRNSLYSRRLTIELEFIIRLVNRRESWFDSRGGKAGAGSAGGGEGSVGM